MRLISARQRAGRPGNSACWLLQGLGSNNKSKMVYTYPHGPSPEQEGLKWKAELAAQKPKAPEKCGGLIIDPAIERYGWIRENPDVFFKFKPRSVFYAVMCCLVVPGALYAYTKYSQQRKDIKAGKPPRDFL